MGSTQAPQALVHGCPEGEATSPFGAFQAAQAWRRGLVQEGRRTPLILIVVKGAKPLARSSRPVQRTVARSGFCITKTYLAPLPPLKVAIKFPAFANCAHTSPLNLAVTAPEAPACAVSLRRLQQAQTHKHAAWWGQTMANPEHVEILKQGVAAWNKWREEHPNVAPDLSGTREVPFDFNLVLRDTAVWGPWPEGRRPRHHDDENGVILAGINLRNANVSQARLTNVFLRKAKLGRCRFTGSNLTGARLSHCDLVYADFARSRIEDVNFRASDLSGANFGRAHVTDANFRDTTWDRATTLNPPGRGIADLSGDPRLQRAWLDQLYIERTRSSFGTRPEGWRALLEPIVALRRPAWLILGLIGALCGAIATAPSSGATLLEHFGSASAWFPVILAALLGAFVGLTLSTFWGRRFVFTAWALFDFGRSWASVALFAAALIILFGTLYSTWLIPGGHVAFVPDDGSEEHWLYPWFIAAMGFATLGIGDFSRPLTGLGQLMMIANVLAGFTTFGLLLSVLGNTFARRAG